MFNKPTSESLSYLIDICGVNCPEQQQSKQTIDILDIYETDFLIRCLCIACVNLPVSKLLFKSHKHTQGAYKFFGHLHLHIVPTLLLLAWTADFSWNIYANILCPY